MLPHAVIDPLIALLRSDVVHVTGDHQDGGPVPAGSDSLRDLRDGLPAPGVIDREAERALIERAQAGEYDAFEALVIHYEGRAYTSAMRILRQREDAEDVVQTVFLKALEKLDTFRGESSFGTWLLRITTNTALNVLRKKRGLPMAAPIDFGDDEPRLGITDRVADWREEAPDVIDRQELRSALDAAIEALPDNYRLVFVLRDLEGLSVRETAGVLGITESNVKVRLLRARLVLRERLTVVFGDPEREAAKPELVRRLERGERITTIDSTADASTAGKADQPNISTTPNSRPDSKAHQSGQRNPHGEGRVGP